MCYGFCLVIVVCPVNDVKTQLLDLKSYIVKEEQSCLQ